MTKEKLDELLETAKEASLIAGKKILEIYNSDDFEVELKGDNSPLTKADIAAHDIIVSFLEPTNLPILSEEGRDIPYNERKNWKYIWIVDPLDGTKEFIKRNGEFTVNIALIRNQEPILGVVYAPVLDKLYAAAEGLGGTLKTKKDISRLNPIDQLDLTKPKLRVVASRSHLNEETQAFLDKLNEPEIVSMGSSLKFMVIAEGNADVYPRFAPTMEWDTAAAHAVLNELNGKVFAQDGKSLEYNKKNLLNPYFRAG
ncbi:3'(2'),5'-bisphosphate nucleotidase CysQ [Roseivirga misakiensis]|uniref:3'(2'),5'-bisphosphate nucleotidase CysQ n=1 Tax=Roseivirga misakiensis TaxID=1563681 RepID=A0A1E5T5Y1_9BACT|nr:3'(2'),5'-bisphosphate nucleotidase CysQ [Roseivirga misakiensis]OEK06792.1 3'(2'),5'-bisphosphate nucleotidase [Roseivirga misakiensis]